MDTGRGIILMVQEVIKRITTFFGLNKHQRKCFRTCE